MSEDRSTTEFEGFDRPRYTPVPDALFDQLLPILSLVELRVLLYIIRRTFGFKKDADTISVSQMEHGITTRDGRVLDRGTGLSTGGVRKGLRGLLDRRIIVAVQNTDDKGASLPTTYALRFKGEGVNGREPSPATPVNPPPSHPLPHNRTDSQDTAGDPSNRPEHVEVITGLVQDLRRELRDQASASSTTTRMINIFTRSGLELGNFVQMVYEARARTKQYTSNVQAGEGGRRSMMAYFFRVLEELCGTAQGR